jgi:hypothetical protein
MGFCDRPGEDPNPWKQFGPETTSLYVLCRQRKAAWASMDSGWGITGGGRPPCWRTLKESCKGLGSVSLKVEMST